MSLLSSPNEMIEAIADELLTYPDVASFVRVNRRLHAVLNIHLYRRSYKEEYRSERNALAWASRHACMDTLVRAEALGIPICAPFLLAVAAQNGHLDVVKFLFPRVCRERAAPRENALVIAYRNNHLDVFRFLVDNGADLEAVDDEHMAILHFAARSGDIASMELLLNRGANVNAPASIALWTPLYHACDMRQAAAVEFLLEKGADSMARDAYLETPMHIAAWSGCLEAVKILIGKGADHREINEDGWPPVLMAIESMRDGTDAVASYLIKLDERITGGHV